MAFGVASGGGNVNAPNLPIIVQGPPGPSGTPGVAATVVPAATPVDAAHAVQPDPAAPGSVQAVANPATARFSGLSTHSTAAGHTQAVQYIGPVAPATLSLGAGVACAVGCKADGAPCRVTDPACVSATNIIGWCDTAGTIFVQSRVADVVNVLDWGLDPTGATPCDAMLATLFANVNTGLWQAQTFYFPEGIYRFDSPWPSVPTGCWIVGAGNGATYAPRYYSGAGTTLAFFGNGTAVLFQSAVGGNARHGGGVRHLRIVSGNPNGWASAPAIANIGLEIIGDTTVTIDDVRFGSFKYQISVDGGEVIWINRPRFDGGPFQIGGVNYDGYPDMSTNRDQVLAGPVSVTVDHAASTYTRASGSFITDGLRVGMCGNWSGFVDASNNGAKLIVALSATVMQVTESKYNIPPYVGANETAAAASFDCFDSATAVRMGEWQFPFGGSTNSVHLTAPSYNNSRFGSWHRGGVGHYVRGLASELHGGYAVVDGGQQIHFSEASGEGYDLGGKGGIWVRAGAIVIGMHVHGCFFGKNRPAVQNDGALHGLSIGASDVSACWGVGVPGDTFWPLSGAGFYTDVCDAGGNTYNTNQGALSATEFGFDGYGQEGNAVGHQTPPIAVLDVVAKGYSLPARMHRIGARHWIEERSPASPGTAGRNETYRRIYSSGTNVGALVASSSEWAAMSVGAPTSVLASVDMPDRQGGWLEFTSVGNDATNAGDGAMFVYRQQFRKEGATLALIGAQALVQSDNPSGAFPVPTFAVVGTYGFGVTVAPHPTKAINWAVTLSATSAGR